MNTALGLLAFWLVLGVIIHLAVDAFEKGSVKDWWERNRKRKGDDE